MTLEFPRLVFKNIGSNLRHGGTYSAELVETQQEYESAIKGGWFGTLPEAIDGKPLTVVDVPTAPLVLAPIEEEVKETISDADLPDTGMPTRDELERKATELGLTFHHRLKDENLLKMIDEAIAAHPPVEAAKE